MTICNVLMNVFRAKKDDIQKIFIQNKGKDDRVKPSQANSHQNYLSNYDLWVIDGAKAA